MDTFFTRCQRQPHAVRSWVAYKQLKQKIEDYQTVLPLLVDLSKPAIRARHWAQIEEMVRCA